MVGTGMVWLYSLILSSLILGGWLIMTGLGMQRRSNMRTIGGCLCLLPTAFLVGAISFGMDLLPYKPTAWVISDLQLADSTQANRAWSELQKRISAGKLSASNRYRLIEMGLKSQPEEIVSSIGNDLNDLLGKWALDGTLSEAQKKVFFEPMLKPTLKIGRKLLANDCISCEMVTRVSSSRHLTIRCGAEAVMDGKPVTLSHAWKSDNLMFGTGTITYPLLGDL